MDNWQKSWHSPACSSRPWSWWSVSSSAPWLRPFRSLWHLDNIRKTTKRFLPPRSPSTSCNSRSSCIRSLFSPLSSRHTLRQTTLQQRTKRDRQKKIKKLESEGERRKKVNLTLDNVPPSGTSKHPRALFSVLRHSQKAWDLHGVNLISSAAALELQLKSVKDGFTLSGQLLYKTRRLARLNCTYTYPIHNNHKDQNNFTTGWNH